jgi:hypothetical protein
MWAESPKETFETCKRKWDDIAKELEWESVEILIPLRKMITDEVK